MTEYSFFSFHFHDRVFKLLGVSNKFIINIGNRTEWSPIWSAMIQVINKIKQPRSGSPICLITTMITDWIGRHKVLLSINHIYSKICDTLGFFKIKTPEISKVFVSLKKAIQVQACDGACCPWHGMTCTVLLHCPISPEIRTVDSQSELRIWS